MGTRYCPLGLTASLLLSVVFVLSPVSLPRAITPFGAICLFFTMIALFFDFARMAGSCEFHAPLLLLLVLAALVFGVFGLNDNHTVRRDRTRSKRLPPIQQPECIRSRLSALAARQGGFDQEKPYPIYVVAAEGGGIYAAFRAATFLTSLQDLCPRFSHHLFAISSVSGGSVGAAIFSGLDCARQAKPTSDFVQVRGARNSVRAREPSPSLTLLRTSYGMTFYLRLLPPSCFQTSSRDFYFSQYHP